MKLIKKNPTKSDKNPKFSEYYKDKYVVDTYEEKRERGLKSKIVRVLERIYVLKLLNNENENKKILEAGIGTGYITEILKNKGEFTGFDISETMIQKTKQKYPDLKTFQLSILDEKLFKKINQRFDYIVSIRVISHFNNKDALKSLENLKTLLNKKGLIIFNLENNSFTRSFLRNITQWGSTRTFQYSKKDLKELLEESNLEINDYYYLDHLFMIPLHLLNKILKNKLDNFIKLQEIKLSKIKFSSSNIFLSCKPE